MKALISDLLLTISFFTRIPLPEVLWRKILPDRDLASAAWLFPLIGLLIGGLSAAVWLLLAHLLPHTVAAAVTLLFAILLTGALHEDGLADCADGLGATKDREKCLEIMRDSRLGTYGALALVLSFALRWSALASLGIAGGMTALIIAHATSRSALIFVMKYFDYVRPQGLGKMASGHISILAIVMALAVPLMATPLLGHPNGLYAIAIALFIGLGFAFFLKCRIGGYTGDGLGAVQQITEITLLIALAGLWA